MTGTTTMIGTAIGIAMITDSWLISGQTKMSALFYLFLSLNICAAISLVVFVCSNARPARSHNLNVEFLRAA